MSLKRQDLKYQEAWRFLFAGISNMGGASVTNPIEVVKTRMQLDNELAFRGAGSGTTTGTINIFQNRKYKGIPKGMATIVKEEGFLGLYKGLLPSLMREGSYSTIRLGAYEPMKQVFGATDPTNTPLWKKICAGAVSGSIAGAIATPTDVVRVRQQAEGPGSAKRYNGTLQAFKHIFIKEGVRGLYVGIVPTVQRAAVVTATQIPSYDHTKHTLLNMELMQEGPRLHIISAMVAGFATAFTTSPIDVIKTRVMNQKEKEAYKSTLDCFLKTLRSEGPFAFYKGVFPNWMRIGPHTVVTFFIFEQLRKAIGMVPV